VQPNPVFDITVDMMKSFACFTQFFFFFFLLKLYVEMMTIISEIHDRNRHGSNIVLEWE
jgi:hypothetical protein